MNVPALNFEMRMLTPIAIDCGLILEWMLLHFAFDLSWKRAAWIDVVKHSASTAYGIFLIPLVGLPLPFCRFLVFEVLFPTSYPCS